MFGKRELDLKETGIAQRKRVVLHAGISQQRRRLVKRVLDPPLVEYNDVLPSSVLAIA